MSRKSKGINAERDLIHKFWAHNWAAIRVAGSGSMSYPAPDVLAGNNIRKLAIECKASKEKTRYIEKEQVENLKEFAKIFGAETWIAVKFNNMEWYFLTLEDIKDVGNNYVITEDIIKNKGLLFEELLR